MPISFSCDFETDLCGFLSQNVAAGGSSQGGQGGAGPALWRRVRGGGRGPTGHNSAWYAGFDVGNYQHRPLDRGYLVGPQA